MTYSHLCYLGHWHLSILKYKEKHLYAMIRHSELCKLFCSFLCCKQNRREFGILVPNCFNQGNMTIFVCNCRQKHTSTFVITYSQNNLTFNPLRIWYMRNCTWSSVSLWHFTTLLRSAPIRCVTKYLSIIKHAKITRNYFFPQFRRIQVGLK